MIGLRFRGDNFSTLPVDTPIDDKISVPQISAGIGGAEAEVFPHFAADGGWASEIVIINRDTRTLSYRVDLFKQDGTRLTTRLNGQSGSSFTNLSVPPGGTLVLAPRNARGDSDF